MSKRSSIVDGLLASWRAIGGRRRDLAELEPFDERRLDERRRDLRVLFDIEEIHLLVDGQLLPICDLSAHGFSVIAPDLPSAPFCTAMLLGGETVSMEVQLENRRGELAGCRILTAEPIWNETVQQILDPIQLGQLLREIDARFVAPDESGNHVRWFQGGPTCDLFIWHAPHGSFVAAQLFFMGQVVDWSPEHGVRTGAVKSGARGSYAATELFQLTQPADAEVLTVAHRILSAADLPDDIQALLRLRPT